MDSCCVCKKTINFDLTSSNYMADAILVIYDWGKIKYEYKMCRQCYSCLGNTKIRKDRRRER